MRMRRSRMEWMAERASSTLTAWSRASRSSWMFWVSTL